MGRKYLLAAEADKIQDLLFKSSRLREVAGGSMLLARFCDEAPACLGAKPEQMIIHAGGGFRLVFSSYEEAETFGDFLAEAYRLATGGSLSVAEPVEYDDGRSEDGSTGSSARPFRTAAELADGNLRKTKRLGGGWEATPQFPYAALCESCGVGLASAYASHNDEARGEPRYLCRSCEAKALERSRQSHAFTNSLLERIKHAAGVEAGPDGWYLPGSRQRSEGAASDPADDVARCDPRGYVAYVLADGNDTGSVFRACETPEEMRALSAGLEDVMWDALAQPGCLAAARTEEARLQPRGFVPVYPLIVGGDDVLVLTAAPWALDFADRFCSAYQSKMEQLLTGPPLKRLAGTVPVPSVSVAVVICKSGYPYFLAHQFGTRLLAGAKQVTRRLALHHDPPGNGCSSPAESLSAVSFGVILGGRTSPETPSDMVRPSLGPYWMGVEAERGIPPGWGITLRRLIEQRSALELLPGKRRAQLRELYDVGSLPRSSKKEDMDPWRTRLERLLDRVARAPAAGLPTHSLAEALRCLGGEESPYWYKVTRWPDPPWWGHGLPDLMEAWDFALDLSRACSEYRGEE